MIRRSIVAILVSVCLGGTAFSAEAPDGTPLDALSAEVRHIAPRVIEFLNEEMPLPEGRSWQLDLDKLQLSVIAQAELSTVKSEQLKRLTQEEPQSVRNRLRSMLHNIAVAITANPVEIAGAYVPTERNESAERPSRGKASSRESNAIVGTYYVTREALGQEEGVSGSGTRTFHELVHAAHHQSLPEGPYRLAEQAGHELAEDLWRGTDPHKSWRNFIVQRLAHEGAAIAGTNRPLTHQLRAALSAENVNIIELSDFADQIASQAPPGALERAVTALHSSRQKFTAGSKRMRSSLAALLSPGLRYISALYAEAPGLFYSIDKSERHLLLTDRNFLESQAGPIAERILRKHWLRGSLQRRWKGISGAGRRLATRARAALDHLSGRN